MKKKLKNKDVTKVAARVAGEDLKQGDYVTVLSETIQLPSYLWCGSNDLLSADEPIQYRYLPRDAGLPLKVVAICLPFVYAKEPTGGINTLDIRQKQLARLDKEGGRAVWELLQGKAS